MKSLKDLVKSNLRRAGFEIRRLTQTASPVFQLRTALDHFEVDLVLDVGANTGQFAAELRSAGYKGAFISFEPLADAHKLLEATAAGDAKWNVYKRTAVGDRDGEVEINVAGNSVSSSVLPMTRLHSAAAAGSAYVGKETVPITTMDTIATNVLSDSSQPFLKIDTQGYEEQVLSGARKMLPRCRGVLCELSLVPLYDGQTLWLELVRYLGDRGFTLWSIQRGFTDPRDGRTLQVDATFFRV